MVKQAVEKHTRCLEGQAKTAVSTKVMLNTVDAATSEGRTFYSTGIIRRVCDEVFHGLLRSPEKESKLLVSALEIYNEQLLDLSREERGRPLSMAQRHWQGSGGRPETATNVLGLQELEMKSSEELLAFLEECTHRRKTSETQMNGRRERTQAQRCQYMLPVIDHQGHTLS